MSIEFIHRDVAKRPLVSVAQSETGGAVASSEVRTRIKPGFRATISMHMICCKPSRNEECDRREYLEFLLNSAVELKLFEKDFHEVQHDGVDFLNREKLVSDIVVGEGDLSSPNIPALDFAIASMECGEKAMFAAMRNASYAGNEHDILFAVSVSYVMPPVDLTPLDAAPGDKITKFVIQSKPSTAALATQTPLYHAKVVCTTWVVSPFNDASKCLHKDRELVIGSKESCVWLDAALMSMVVGEFSLISDQSTGDVYKVLLKEIVANEKPPRTQAELLSKVEALKAAGNALIDEKHPRSHACYDAALFWIRHCAPQSGNTDELMDIRCVIESNLAQAHLTWNRFHSALYHANAALSVCRGPIQAVVKILFRRSKANRGLKLLDEAMSDIQRAMQTMRDQHFPVDDPLWKTLDDVKCSIEAEMA